MTPGRTPRTSATGSSRRRNLLGSAVAAGALLALTGCGSYPGSAAVVGDSRISDDRVDAAAQSLCSANISGAEARGEPAPELATRGARLAAVQLLIDNELSAQFAEAEGLEADAQAVSAALEQNRQGIAQLPADQRADFEELLRGFSEGQQILVEAGRAELGPEAPQEQALAAGAQARTAWAEDVEVTVDPRFGEWSQGTLTPDNGSASVPVSERAAEGANTEPSAQWVAGLPQSQKCS